METPDKYLRSMLEMSSGLNSKYFGPPLECASASTFEDDERKESCEGISEMPTAVKQRTLQRIHCLQKEASYWENKCLNMRLELQKQTLECKQEMKQVENKGAATVAELQEQLNETLQEEEKLKALNDSLREEVETRKKAAAGHSKANPKAPVIDPEKLLEAAKNMEVGKLQYMQYQIYLMLNGMYKMYPQPGYYPY